MKGEKLVAAAAAAAAAKANNGANQNHNQNQTDFLVCFPSTARLALMPKAICSPSRPPELHKRHSHHHPRHATNTKSTCTTTTKPTPGSSRSRSHTLFKTKTRNDRDGPEAEEPTSPKVTCAGQIKVRSTKPRSSNASSRPSTDSKNWISVMEEIERIRKDGKKKPGNSWWEALGFKKDVLQIFSSFHGLRFNMGCFSGPIDCTSDEEEEDEVSVAREEEASSSKDVFSKWFMLIEQNHDNGNDLKEEIVLRDEEEEEEESEVKDDMQNPVVPPSNALLLMRCRSAPAKGLLNRAELLETEEDRIANKSKEEEEEEQAQEEKLLVMRCAPDFFKVSMDIAKETWVVGGELDLLARSRSCRR